MGKSIKALFGISLFLSLNFLCKNLTGDFSENHLIRPLPQNKEASLEKIDPSILHQKYTYLGRGNQAFVFLSEDKEHVLKLFRPLFPFYRFSFFGQSHRIRPVKFPFAKTFFEKVYAKELYEQKNRDFQSFENAFEFLREETQLEYLHLSKTNHLKHKLELYDKIHVLHWIDLDNTCFLIQRKTDLLYPTLASLIDQKEVEKAKELISAFAYFSFQLVSKGVRNPTTIEKNLGCIGLVPVQIDIGRVFKAKNDSHAYKLKQLIRYTRHMDKWLSRKSPDLKLYLEKCIEEKKSFLINESTIH